MDESIRIKGARAGNLKDVTVDLPRGKLVVVTGISGSGKSSLAFDTLYAEGQRRFAQSLSSYARQFLGRMSKPDVDSIDGVPPAIAIEQKVSVKNPRSTVATTTEIYDSLRLIFARIGKTYSPVSGSLVHKDTPADVVRWLEGQTPDGPMYILADVGWADAPDKVELLLRLKEDGFSRMMSGSNPLKIDDLLQSQEFPAEAMLLVDRFSNMDDRTRLLGSIAEAFRAGSDRMSVLAGSTRRDFCGRFELDGITFREPDDYLFSFNSPLGACPVCGGLGKIIGISEDLVVPDKTKSIYDGAIACWRGEKMRWFNDRLILAAESHGIPIFEPWCNLTDSQKDVIWNSRSTEDETSIVGINEFFEWVETQRYKIQFKYMLSRFSGRSVCHACHGTRLREEALYVKIGGKNIAQILSMNVKEAEDFFNSLELSDTEKAIVRDPLGEVRNRLALIDEVGLGYLTLSRACNTLSGGESQRINLVSALGSSLVGSMYILDEPSIGLHPRDTSRLIGVLKKLRDLGNTVVVVEHDEEIIAAADEILDMGPLAGSEGGKVMFQGKVAEASPSEIQRSLTLQYILGGKPRYVREKRRPQFWITVGGAMEHNLKGMDVRIPLGVLTVVSGVSGSGKSSLVGDILYPALFRHINESGELPGVFKGLSGNLDRITGVEYVDQSPIGRSSRSNPVTYLKAYDLIRKLLADQQYSRINGFTPTHFSFNHDGGRCPECQGEGVVRIEMQFMSDVEMVCEECGGKRFKPEILEVRYRGLNVDDILNLSISEAIDFFADGQEPEAREIVHKLQPLMDVGLGYLKLGQSSSTLSGGESQRIKLAYFLSLSDKKGGIMFIFDEPTTGLHIHDVEKLLRSFDALLKRGHSLVVVEHNTDVIRSADYLIELGPDAGEQGGSVVFEGTPEELKESGHTFTSQWI